jgi:simple sugar transport system ATP-binding protein
MSEILTVNGVSKFYGPTAAIQDISFGISPGECVALLGENGAGKSTLCKVISGVVHPTKGSMSYKGKPYAPDSPKTALENGIAMVFQETSLVPSMNVAQNLYLGIEKSFNPLRRLTIDSQQFLQSLNFDVDPTALVSTLGAAKKQMVEIARALLHKAEVIIFDEPTATLTPEEKQHFFRLVDSLLKNRVAVVFISHALEEALAISHRIVVMRDGQLISNTASSETDRPTIIQQMIGRSLDETLHGDRKKNPRKAGEKVLGVENLRWGKVVRNASLSVFGGQVTGVFGLVGSGRTELFKIVAGVYKRDIFYGGKIHLGGVEKRYRTPAPAIRDGIAYITEDRKSEGMYEGFSVLRNIALGKSAKPDFRAALVGKTESAAESEDWISRLNISMVSENASAEQLSGGNQQKMVIAKSLAQSPDLVILDEPTRGVDVGAIMEIHELINALADQGKAVVVISSYLPEIMALSDRILVARSGRIVEEFNSDDVTEEKIMYAAVH